MQPKQPRYCHCSWCPGSTLKLEFNETINRLFFIHNSTTCIKPLCKLWDKLTDKPTWNLVQSSDFNDHLLVGSSPSSPNVLIAHFSNIGGQATKGGKRMMFGKVRNLVLAGVEPFFIDVSSVSNMAKPYRKNTTGVKLTGPNPQEVKVKPQPAKTVVKAFCVSALKQQIWSHRSAGMKGALKFHAPLVAVYPLGESATGRVAFSTKFWRLSISILY